MYRSITENIEVTVEPFYLEEQSSAEDYHFVWAYRVTVINHSEDTVQLLSRHWKITDGNGVTEEVKGPGVIGEEPIIKPGDSYQYSSGCPLATNSGMMVGTYTMQGPDGNLFTIAIPAFSLDIPHQHRTLN